MRKIGQQNIRKITKVAGGKTFSVTLPIGYMRKLKWRERQKVVIKMLGERLIISDWKPKKSKSKR